MIGPVMKTDAAVMSAGQRAFSALPPQVRLVLVGLALLVGMAGCSAAWVDQQDYQPSPNICRAHEVERTDCVHVNRVPVEVER
ncbi:hypothetical protein [Nocardia farcinica]|uniref:hypothetical protein n=1 Tax=Nocardia farcinica TaxID=37329 RepID=UPI002454D0AE|nr:hypothetical protein [Nocardia farcinica]